MSVHKVSHLNKTLNRWTTQTTDEPKSIRNESPQALELWAHDTDTNHLLCIFSFSFLLFFLASFPFVLYDDEP